LLAIFFTTAFICWFFEVQTKTETKTETEK